MKCKICKKEISQKDLSDESGGPKKAVYHASFGVACLHHPGVADHYEELLAKANEDLLKED